MVQSTMGFNNPETDRLVSREEFSYCRELPSLEKSGLSKSSISELLKDPDQNRRALIEIVFEYRDVFRQEDLIDYFFPFPYDEIEDIDPSVMAWSDNRNLETLADVTQELFNGNEINAEIHFHAQALIASYHLYASSNLDSHISIVEGMREAISFYHSEIRRLQVETREPETLREIAENWRLIKVCESQMTRSQSEVAVWVSKLKLSLQASRYITTLAVS